VSLLLLLLSAFCEAVWNIFLTKSNGLTDWTSNLPGILCLLIGIFTFKGALAGMPLSIAVVIWSGVSLLLTIAFDVYFFSTKIDFKVGFFMILCIVSIIGLQYYAKR
jgi:multidrug transporter EmrE-like cation transporter